MSSTLRLFSTSCCVAAALLVYAGQANAQAGAQPGAGALPMAPDVFGGYASDHIIVKFKPGAFERSGMRPAARGVVGGAAEPALSGQLNGELTAWRAHALRRAHAPAFGSPEVAAAIGLDRTFIIEVPEGTDAPAMVAALGAFTDEIEMAEVDGIGGVAEFIPDDADFSAQYGLHNTGQSVGGVDGVVDADIDAPEAWGLHTGDVGTVTVAIIDSGVDPHPEIADRMVPGTNTADPNNPDLTTGDCVYEGVQHGTHVAGTVAAQGNNVDGVAGVTWGANIMPIRVLQTLNPCFGFESDAAEGIIWAVDHGADICNMSLQYYTGTTELRDAVDYAHAHGVLVVAAAGNNNIGPWPFSIIAFPAKYDNAMAISATTNEDAFANWSRWGDQLDVCAPGNNIYSLGTDTGYGFASGTSMATPHVSGTAALMLSYVPGLPHVAMRHILADTADDLGGVGWDDHFGFGRINAAAALTQAEKTVWISSSFPPDGAIDARVPHEPDGSAPVGWDSVDVTFTGDTLEVVAEDFSVTVEGSLDPAPRVFAVLATGSPDTVTVVLDSAIPVGAWTTIQHDYTGTKVRLGYLPGDVDGNGTSDQSDIIAVIDAINLVVPAEPWQSDVDRSGVTDPSDIIREIDLLNGASAYDSFLGVSLP